MSIKQIIKDAFKDAINPPYPYEPETFNFPDNMRALGYDVMGYDTVIDGNAKVMLKMACHIKTLQEQVELLAEQVDILKDYSVAGFAHDPLKEDTNDQGDG